MHITENIVLNTYSIIILVIIGVYSYRHDDRKTVQYRLYMIILIFTSFMLAVDSFGRMDGTEYALFPILNTVGNFALFLSNPFVPCLWLAYAHYHITLDWQKTRRLLYFSAVYCGAFMVVLIATMPYRWFYYIDPYNCYHRGPYFLSSVSVTIIPILLALVLILKGREKINPKHYHSLLIFPVPAMFGILLQAAFYGVSMVWNGVVISLLIIFLNIQDHNIYTDYLTNVCNRRKLEEHLTEQIKKSYKGKGKFAAILLDVDDFKTINDNFGHDAGDEALRVSARLLSSCLRSGDFIGRYGGDEFLCILEMESMKDLEALVARIKKKFSIYNKYYRYSYRINFSMGYDVYDPENLMAAPEFIKHLDNLLYKNKMAQKSINSN